MNLINPYHFMEKLTSKLKENAIVVAGNGTACISLFKSGIVKKGQRMFWNSGCASMGYALPAAIGACVAGDREVICIEGDGSLMMNIQELQTVKHYNLPIKLFVLNNGGYHSLQETQTNYFKGDFIGCTKEDVSFPNLFKIAETYNFKYFSFSTDKIDEILNYPNRCICEVMLNDYKFLKESFNE
jgi:acetolactate synthase-1/2/3 large subunit